MIKLAASFKRGDDYLPASECGVVTQVGEVTAAATTGMALGIAIVVAPVAMLLGVSASAGLLAAGHHLDHKKLDAQDNTPVVDVPAS